jgi:hypothetical protein
LVSEGYTNVCVGISTSSFLVARQHEAELGEEGTYTFGYAFTGNMANCGRWIYTSDTKNEDFEGKENVYIGMLVDLDHQCGLSCNLVLIDSYSLLEEWQTTTRTTNSAFRKGCQT